MKRITVLLLAAAVAITSCQKGDPAPPVVPPVDKYMNYTSGSEWNIETINDASTSPVTVTYKLTSTNRDSTVNSKAYHVYTNSIGANEYYYNTGNDYYNYRVLSPGLGGGAVEILYLKDNAAVGTEWSQTFPVTISGVPITATFTNKIEERGTTKTVNAVEYKDVIKVKTSLQIAGIPFQTTITTDVSKYYAPKVGPITERTAIDISSLGTPLYSFEEDKRLMSSIMK